MSAEMEDDTTSSSRRTYLLTYSQADRQKYPTVRTFVDVVLKAFAEVKSSKEIREWAACEEKHQDSGTHFHMSINLMGSRRWKPVHKYILENEGISVNFSTKLCGYVAAYRYVSKGKPIHAVIRSPGHTTLHSTPKTARAMNSFAKKCSVKRKSLSFSPSGSPVVKKRRLDKSQVAEIILAEGLKDERAVQNFSKQRKLGGEPDLYNFVVSSNPKSLADLVKTTWDIEKAEAAVNRAAKDRLTILRDRLRSPDPCERQDACTWYACAREILSSNDICHLEFARIMRKALKDGRRKGTNVMICGPTNCGKSFLLDPLEISFHAFVNPANNRYCWVGLEEAEVVYLNDFRWSPEMISWSDFLLLLEGSTVHLPRPRNVFTTDLRIDRKNNVPFFATSKTPIEFRKFNLLDEVETKMMDSRWHVFKVTRNITNPIYMPPCSRCFARLVLSGIYDENGHFNGRFN